MNTIHSPLSAEARKPTVEALQSSLVELIDLSLAAKQAHWNVIGSHFRSVHRQLDEVVDIARKHTDLVAERIVALGAAADGRVETVVAERSSDAMPAGYLQDEAAVDAIIDRLKKATERVRGDMHATGEPDPTSQDLLIDALHDLEEQSWMLQAMRA